MAAGLTGQTPACMQEQDAQIDNISMKQNLLALLLLSSAAHLSSLLGADNPALDGPAQIFDITKIQHVIVIYQENWSFDGLYARFPNAKGYAFDQIVKQTVTGLTNLDHLQ